MCNVWKSIVECEWNLISGERYYSWVRHTGQINTTSNNTYVITCEQSFKNNKWLLEYIKQNGQIGYFGHKLAGLVHV